MVKLLKKEPVVKGNNAVLRIPLGTPFVGSKKRLEKDLDNIGTNLDICRNAMQRCWLRWHESNPNYEPPVKLDETGNPVLDSRGNPQKESALFPKEINLYEFARTLHPEIASKLVANASNEIVKKLKIKMPYNHNGKAKNKAEAIILNEISPSSYRSKGIPVPSQDTIMGYNGLFSKDKVDELTKQFGKSDCIIKFPLFSTVSGRKFTNMICRLDIGNFTDGQKEVLKKICRKEWSLGDSSIRFKEKKKGNRWKTGWYLYLTYNQPRTSLNLNKDNVATLNASDKTSRQPFNISFCETKWNIGNISYKYLVERITIKRKVIRFRYRDSLNKGHGKKKFFSKLRKESRTVVDAQERFQWDAIKQILNFCVKNNCGTLLYKEPSLGLRNYNTWFNENGLQFSWDKFKAKIKHKCNLFGIELVVERTSKNKN